MRCLGLAWRRLLADDAHREVSFNVIGKQLRSVGGDSSTLQLSENTVETCDAKWWFPSEGFSRLAIRVCRTDARSNDDSYAIPLRGDVFGRISYYVEKISRKDEFHSSATVIFAVVGVAANQQEHFDVVFPCRRDKACFIFAVSALLGSKATIRGCLMLARSLGRPLGSSLFRVTD